MSSPGPSAARALAFGHLVLLAACRDGAPAAPLANPAPSPSDALAQVVDAGRDAGIYPGLTVFAAAPADAVATRFFEFLPEARATVIKSQDPSAASAAAGGSSLRVALLTDLSCGECYRLAGSGLAFEVHGGNALGAQYGLAQLLEEVGFRFFHPWQTKAPAGFAPPSSTNIGPTFTPEMTLRGLHLHTLHPIESYFTFWASRASNGGTVASGAPTGVDGARRVIDWTVKNRGNYVEWSALNDIVTADAQDLAAWRSHTRTIIDYAHARGIKIGIGTELFGNGNLQLSFDLLDDEQDPQAKVSVDQRWHLLTDGLPWDTVDISFGEFSGTDAQTFITSLDLAYTELEAVAPGTELAATVHVGNEPGLEVTYDGKKLLYYFLVQYADPHIVPWIHTVMYFDFFQSVDGAYNMPSFDQHRAYLEGRLQAGQPVAYYPEDAYWVAWDDSVPQYFPVYMRSRWLDQTGLASAAAKGGYGALAQQVLFSSGWEWGYWQNDYAALRMSFSAPAAWTDAVDEMFAPWGAQGTALASLVGQLGELQSRYLIDRSLAAYVAGADGLIELGWEGDIISQPVRTSLSQLAAMSDTDRASFETKVLAPLRELDTQVQALDAKLAALGLDTTDPWLAEVTDGFAVDADRVHFSRSLYEAVAAFAASKKNGGWLAKADAPLADATTVVARRGANLHYPNPSQILAANTNSTYYQAGYLTEAATLCYWMRERTQARAVILNDTTAPPYCLP